jgi:hypothetical protein
LYFISLAKKSTRPISMTTSIYISALVVKLLELLFFEVILKYIFF